MSGDEAQMVFFSFAVLFLSLSLALSIYFLIWIFFTLLGLLSEVKIRWKEWVKK